MLLPGETHRESVDREVDVGNEGTLFHMSQLVTLRTTNLLDDLFDAQFHVCGATLVVQNAHVF
jgi:hypothetical protein